MTRAGRRRALAVLAASLLLLVLAVLASWAVLRTDPPTEPRRSADDALRAEPRGDGAGDPRADDAESGRRRVEAPADDRHAPREAGEVRYRVQVVDAFDRPVEGARVELGRLAGPPLRAELAMAPESFRLEVVAVSDEDGVATSWGDGGWACRVTADGYTDGYQPWTGAIELRVVLARAFGVSGLVVDDKDAPVAGAIVRSGFEARVQAVSGEDGRFELHGLLRADPAVPLTAVASDGRSASVEVQPGTNDVRLVLFPRDVEVSHGPRVVDPAPRRARVIVARGDGTPVAGVAFPDARNGATTDARGVADLELPPGREGWTVTRMLDPPGTAGTAGRHYRVRVDAVREGEARPMRVVLPGPTPVTIVVDGDAGPLTPDDGVEVRLLSNRVSWDARAQAFVEDARFGLRQTLVVTSPGYARHESIVAITPDVPNDVRVRLLRSAVLRGSVSGALRERDELATIEDGRVRQTLSELEAGAWELTGVTPGDVDVVVLRGGAPLVRRRVLVAPGADVDLGELVVGGLHPVGGTVRDASGAPLGGCRVVPAFAPSGRDAFGRPVDSSATRTHVDGSFELAAGDGVTIDVRIERDGFGTAFAVVGDEPADVTLHPHGRVRLLCRPGPQLASAAAWPRTCRVTMPDLRRRFEVELRSLPEESRDGVVALMVGGLPRGRLLIEALPSDSGPHEVDVRSGETTDVWID